MKKTLKVFLTLVLLLTAVVILILFSKKTNTLNSSLTNSQSNTTSKFADNPLSVEYQRNKEYPGSNFVVEKTLQNGNGYKQFIASYLSDGYKIYGLLSIPTSVKPEGGYPAIIFNHGYIPPEEYRTTERYTAYFAGLASNGYVVFKPDYRGHGDSEGQPTGAYFSNAYITDVLNALESVKKLPEVNSKKIGMWGHSLGGFLTLRSMVISKDIKVGVIWGGVVGSYEDMSKEWWAKRRVPSFTPSSRELQSNRPSRQKFIEEFGEPSASSEFWRAISSTTYLQDVSGPIQLHHGLSDETVPYQLSQILEKDLKDAGKTVELYTYIGSDHNISQGFNLAMERTVTYFDKYLK